MKASRARKCRLELFGKVPGASTAAGASFSCSHTDGRRGAVPLWPMTARNSSALRQRRRAARSRSWWGSRDAHAIAARSLVTLRGTPGLQLIEHYRTHVRRGGPNQELQLRTRLILFHAGSPKPARFRLYQLRRALPKAQRVIGKAFLTSISRQMSSSTRSRWMPNSGPTLRGALTVSSAP